MTVQIFDDARGGIITLTDAQWAAIKPPVAALPVSVPTVISDRQFGDGLWNDGIITYAECEAFVSVGEIPPPLQAIVDTLPDDDTGEPTPRKSAIILIKGAKEYDRTHPLVDYVRQALEAADPKWTPAYFLDRWAVWAGL